jgi:hypothetical protein
MFRARSRCLLVGLLMAVCASFANAAVFDVGLQAGVVQQAVFVQQGDAVTFDVVKPLPALVQSDAALMLVAIAPSLAVEHHERRLVVDANAAMTTDLLAQARVIEKVGWRVSF